MHRYVHDITGRRAAAVCLVRANSNSVMVHLMKADAYEKGKPARIVSLLTESMDHKRLLFVLEFRKSLQRHILNWLSF